MKILHTGTLAASAGGPAMSTTLTLRGLMSLGVEATVVREEASSSKVLFLL